MTHPYEKVSFIKLAKRSGGYWVVDPPADYGEAWSFGEDRALELLQWVKRGAIDDVGFVLNQIAEAHGKFREGREGHRGAINGFWRAIGWFAASSAAGTDFDATARCLMDTPVFQTPKKKLRDVPSKTPAATKPSRIASGAMSGRMRAIS